jgi:FG-GAP-like repeat
MWRVAGAGVCVLAGALVAAPTHALEYGAARGSPQTPQPGSGVAADQDARAACGGCHLVPPPEILPRSAWRSELERMARIRGDVAPSPNAGQTSAPQIALAADFERALHYYESAAPKELPQPSPWPPVADAMFLRRGMSPMSAPAGPAVSNVELLDIDGDQRLEIAATEMRHGLLLLGKPYSAAGTLTIASNLSNPAHVAMVDFDSDGIKDLLVADLGVFAPGDDIKGAVVLLRGTGGGNYQSMAIDGWPRVSDVEAADFNADGKLDLAVAAFGWRKVGNLSVLLNSSRSVEPSFSAQTIDPRPGAIHAIPADVNNDGRPDMVALFAQQFEEVVAFVNSGGPYPVFTPQLIYKAPHPNWGSSGIQLVDLDRDGDLDVLLTHGDTFDDQIIKPYHGIQWLENRGSYPFVEHTLAEMPGVSRAQAIDLDGDGDLDVVASAFFATGTARDQATLPSLVWLEQTKPGEFVRHTLETGRPIHATLDVADFDRDGDMDIVVGNFTFDTTTPTPWVDVWENRRIVRTDTAAQ